MGQTELSLIPILSMFKTNFFYNRILKTNKDSMGQTILSYDQNLLERVENAMQIKKKIIIFRTIWVKLCCLNCCQIANFNIDQTICDFDQD